VISAAAIKFGDLVCHLPQPARHHDVLRAVKRMFNGRSDEGHMSERQGFITDKGEFLNREQAYIHARECGQGTPRRDASLAEGYAAYNGKELFSEDLW
jgi:hypothetical protein